MLIHNPHNDDEVMLENDPTTPKTVWRIHALTFSERRAVDRRAGPAPLRALAVHGQVHPPRTDAQLAARRRMTKTEKEAEQAQRVAEAQARLDALSVGERVLYDKAADWYADYDLAVCVYGVDAIDGDEQINVESALECMRPVDAVRLVLGELAGKISALSQVDDEKKEPSPSPAG
jgi:hypothetical protein